MPSFRSLLLQHGYSLVFVWVLGVTAGVPVPADPLLLMMGAMAGDHVYSLPLTAVYATLAAVISDWTWYEVGRLRGRAVLRFLCRFALEPDSCVRSTEIAFRSRGPRTLLLAKFVPGMGLISMPLAGTIHMPRARFLLFDAAGSLLWSTAWLAAGFVFHDQVSIIIVWLGLFGRRAGLIIVALIIGYISFKYVQRWRFLRELRVNRITPADAVALIESGSPVTVLDLRHRDDVEREGFKVAGALVVAPEDLRSRSHEIPDDQEIILYCT